MFVANINLTAMGQCPGSVNAWGEMECNPMHKKKHAGFFLPSGYAELHPMFLQIGLSDLKLRCCKVKVPDYYLLPIALCNLSTISETAGQTGIFFNVMFSNLCIFTESVWGY